MNYDVEWEPEAWSALVGLYDDNEADADEVGHGVEWRLSHDPLQENAEISTPKGPRYITWAKPWKDYPALSFGFRIDEQQFRRVCVIEKVRRANVPDALS